MRLAAVCVAIFLAATALRIFAVDRTIGRAFDDADSLEYVAAAQSIAQTGRFVLHLGEREFQPRQPLGWPLILSGFVRLGVDAEDLVWVNAVVGGLSAALLAWIAAALVTGLARLRANPVLAATLTGSFWALCPLSIDVGRQVMSDEIAALLATAGLALATATLLRPRRRADLAWLLLGGFLIGASALCRALNANLLTPVVAVLLLAAWSRNGLRSAIRTGITLGIGVAVPYATAAWILHRSGWNPLAFHAYDQWGAPFFENLSYYFHPKYAFEGSHVLPWLEGGRRIGHLELSLRHFLGGIHAVTPGDTASNMGLGLAWPVLAWLGAAWLVANAYRDRQVRWLPLTLIVIALAGWLAGHFVIGSIYFFPQQRFYLGALLWCPLFAGTALAGCCARSGIVGRVLGRVLVATTFASLAYGAVAELGAPGERHHPDNLATRRLFANWLAANDEDRREMFIPFDPERAQALGLLTPEARSGIREWGLFPDTKRRPTLIGRGQFPELSDPHCLPLLDGVRADAFPSGARAAGVPRVRLAEDGSAYLLRLEDLEHVALVEYRVPLDSDEIKRGRLRIEETVTGCVPIAGDGVATGWRDGEARLAAHHLNRYRQAIVLELVVPDGDTVTYVIRLIGLALEIRAFADDAEFELAATADDKAQQLRIPMVDFPILAKDSCFVGKRVLRGASPATAYCITSRRIEDCLPAIDRELSPYRFREHRPRVGTAEPRELREWRARADSLGLDYRRTPPGPLRDDPLQLTPAILTLSRAELVVPDFALRELAPRVATIVLAADAPRGVSFDCAPLLDPSIGDWERTIARCFLTAGLRTETRSSRCTEVRYVDTQGKEHSLTNALHSELDLRAPRLILRYESGLEIRINHGDSKWPVRVADHDIELPQSGFAATSPTGLTVIDALHPDTGNRFSYAHNPGHSTVLHGHGSTVRWRDFADDTDDDERRGVIVDDLRSGRRILARGAETRVRPGRPPGFRRLAIHGPELSELSLGRPALGLRAIAFDENATAYDVTDRASWTSLTPASVRVDAGVVRVLAPGVGEVRASLGGLTETRSIPIRTTPLIHEVEIVSRARRALVRYKTDVRVLDPLLMVKRSDGRFWVPVHGNPDPTGKHHAFVIEGLEPETSYDARAFARSQHGLITTQPVGRIVTGSE